MKEKKDLTKYFQIEDRNKKPSLIGNDDLIVKLGVDKWDFKVMNHPQEFLEGISIYENTKGVYCVDSSIKGTNYVIRKISQKEFDEILENRKKEWASWGDYFSTSDNMCSGNLNGPSGERLS